MFEATWRESTGVVSESESQLLADIGHHFAIVHHKEHLVASHALDTASQRD